MMVGCGPQPENPNAGGQTPSTDSDATTGTDVTTGTETPTGTDTSTDVPTDVEPIGPADLPTRPAPLSLSRDIIDRIRDAASDQESDTDRPTDLVLLVDSLGGKFLFDGEGNVSGIDLTSGRSSAADEHISKIADSFDLPVLRASGSGITSESLKKLGTWKNLKELMLQDTQITDDDLAILAALPNLTTLGLRRSARLTDEGLAALTGAPKLARLYLTENAFTGAILPTLAKIEGLMFLDLRGCGAIDEAALKEVSKLSGLTVLRVGGSQITDSVVTDLGRLTGLRALTIEDASITSAGMVALENLPLTELVLARCFGLRDDAIRSIGKIESLLVLSMRDMAVGDAGFAHLAGHPKLRVVKIREIMVGDGVVEHLATLPKLEQVELCATLVSGIGIKRLAAIESLRSLALDEGGLTDDDLEPLTGAKNLTTLRLVGNINIMDTAVDTLIRIPTLKNLDIRGTMISDDGVARLKEALPGCKITR